MDQRTEQLINHFMSLTEEQKDLVERFILALISVNNEKKRKTV